MQVNRELSQTKDADVMLGRLGQNALIHVPASYCNFVISNSDTNPVTYPRHSLRPSSVDEDMCRMPAMNV